MIGALASLAAGAEADEAFASSRASTTPEWRWADHEERRSERLRVSKIATVLERREQRVGDDVLGGSWVAKEDRGPKRSQP